MFRLKRVAVWIFYLTPVSVSVPLAQISLEKIQYTIFIFLAGIGVHIEVSSARDNPHLFRLAGGGEQPFGFRHGCMTIISAGNQQQRRVEIAHAGNGAQLLGREIQTKR